MICIFLYYFLRYDLLKQNCLIYLMLSIFYFSQVNNCQKIRIQHRRLGGMWYLWGLGLCMKLLKQPIKEQRSIFCVLHPMYSDAQFYFVQRGKKIESGIQKKKGRGMDKYEKNQKKCKYRHQLHNTIQNNTIFPTVCILGWQTENKYIISEFEKQKKQAHNFFLEIMFA